MAFNMSIQGFFEFLIRPLTNPIGWVLLIGAAIWIWARLKGKVGSIGKNKNQNTADYTIK